MLTSAALRSLKYIKNSNKNRHKDKEGLFVIVTAKSKTFYYDYAINGKRNTYTVGQFPQLSLADARTKLIEVKELIKKGIDPNQLKKQQKLSNIENNNNTFELVANEYLDSRIKERLSESTIKNYGYWLDALIPLLGVFPITAITKLQLIAAIDTATHKGLNEKAGRLAKTIELVFDYAANKGYITNNIAINLPKPKVTTEHHATLLEPKAIGTLLNDIDNYSGSITTVCALRLLPMLFVRPIELRTMLWSDIDFDKNQWRYKATKTKTDMVVPLSRQVIEILNRLKSIQSNSIYVLPSVKCNEKCMSDATMNGALRRLGYTSKMQTPHGFRATARTLLEEELQQDPSVVEMQLGHTVRDYNGTAYNRTTFIDKRTSMMQLWSDYLEGLKKEV